MNSIILKILLKKVLNNRKYSQHFKKNTIIIVKLQITKLIQACLISLKMEMQFVIKNNIIIQLLLRIENNYLKLKNNKKMLLLILMKYKIRTRLIDLVLIIPNILKTQVIFKIIIQYCKSKVSLIKKYKN